ncbi:MAG TPA: hypothetical protein VF218_03120 [Acidothermaceae bacterium]
MVASWAASPARFREDANSEEDLVVGGYRDRVVIELAQNAADAAVRAGSRGRLRLTLEAGELRAANTGAPLDAAGVESLSTLRASAKRDEAAIGRFGVGFAAVLAVSDEPVIASTTGAVRWSRADALAVVREMPSLEAELTRRGDAVPVLRLPFADVSEAPPAGYETQVRLPLRDLAAEALIRGLLADVDAALLLTMPALESVEIVTDGVTRSITSRLVGDEMVVDGVRWRLRNAAGRLEPDLLLDRGVEERSRQRFEVTWAVPIDESGRPAPLPPTAPKVAHAPTPTDDPVTVPAMLIASFPLEPSRRRIAAGPLRQFLVERAVELYAELVGSLPATVEVSRLVPVGLPAGPLDAELRSGIVARLRELAFLPTRDDDVRLRPSQAALLEVGGAVVTTGLVDVLADVLPSLLPADWARSAPQALAALDVRRIALASVLDELHAVDRPAMWWRELYAALVEAGVSADTLAGLPVPLADGALARSPRGVLMPGAAADLSVFGLRSVDPEAAHPLLLRLGAVEPEPAAILASDAVRSAVERSFDIEDPLPVAVATLGVVAAGSVGDVADHPWLADLALPASDGDLRPAGELLLPDAKLAAVVADDAPFGQVDASYVDRWGAELLKRVGVLDGFAVVREHDVSDDEHDLDLESEYFAYVAGQFDGSEPVLIDEFVAVRDLEFVRVDAWPQALALLAAPDLRSAVVTPAYAVTSTQRRRVLPYTAWWLRANGVVGGRLPSSDPLLGGVYDVVELDLDDEFLAAAGALRDVSDADDGDLVARLADADREVGRAQLRMLYAVASPERPPSRVRAVRGGELAVVDAVDAVVVDQPDLLPLLGNLAVVPASIDDAVRVADALDLALASELADYAVLSDGEPQADHVRHEKLLVADAEGRPTHVRWRYVDDVLHVDAAALAFGLGRGRAWRAADWRSRHLVTELLSNPEQAALLAAECDLD